MSQSATGKAAETVPMGEGTTSLEQQSAVSDFGGLLFIGKVYAVQFSACGGFEDSFPGSSMECPGLEGRGRVFAN